MGRLSATRSVEHSPPVMRRRFARRIALLGGTTTFLDSLVAGAYLMNPKRCIRGPAIDAYERAFAQRIEVRYACSFSAARVGLYGLLQSLGIGAGDEVILQVPTHIVVANAIRYTGARPIYVDCSLDDYNIDMQQAEHQMTNRTKALILQHTFGIPADIDAAMDLAQRYGIVLIEDCVHALGARYKGKPVGSYGRAAIFSTEETKTITSTMGGMVVTNDAGIAAKLRLYQMRCAWPSTWLTARYVLKLMLSYYLTQPHVHRYARTLYEMIGKRQPIPGPTSREEQRGLRPSLYDQRLTNVQAVLALRQLKRLDENVRHRQAVARAYTDHLSARGLCTPKIAPGSEPAFVRYPVWVKDRETALRLAKPHAVLGIWFSSVLEEALSPMRGAYKRGSCPRAEAAARHLINFPTHPRVNHEDVQALVDAIAPADETPERPSVSEAVDAPA